MLYKDMILKLEYHRNQILKAFVKQGYFPNKDEIANKLMLIDERLALFKSYSFNSGSTINIKELNHSLEMLYYDIAFLYKVIEIIYTDKYNSMLLNIETHMSYLEALAVHFKKRADEEIKGTSLGKTLLFKTDNWDIDVKDESIEISVDSLELIQGSEISCFANINNTDKRNILFKFEAVDNALDFTALPYNYNNDTYIVPGEIAIKDHELKLNENFNINSEINIPFDANLENDYKILGGQNKIIVTDKLTNNVSVHDFPTVDKPFEAESNCYISFYIEGKGIVEYSFNKKPFHTNFSIQDGTIKIEKDIQKIFLDVEKGFVCYFNLDKEIKEWATMEEAIVEKTNLIYKGMILVRDFKIREYIRDKKTLYKVKVIINEMDNDEVIESIYIKEID